ncbi:MAG TPA: hypothetical protein VG323_17465 [Thermoanaerobaculia bacterium]|nr:hypothetical protein [Thermoanaerobaculia bacterium]
MEIELRLGHGVHRTFAWTIDYGGPQLQFRGEEPYLEWNWGSCKPSVPFRTWSEVEDAADRLVFRLGYKAAYEERSGDVAGLKSAASAAEADYWETYAVTLVKRALEFS